MRCLHWIILTSVWSLTTTSLSDPLSSTCHQQSDDSAINQLHFQLKCRVQAGGRSQHTHWVPYDLLWLSWRPANTKAEKQESLCSIKVRSCTFYVFFIIFSMLPRALTLWDCQHNDQADEDRLRSCHFWADSEARFLERSVQTSLRGRSQSAWCAPMRGLEGWIMFWSLWLSEVVFPVKLAHIDHQHNWHSEATALASLVTWCHYYSWWHKTKLIGREVYLPSK